MLFLINIIMYIFSKISQFVSHDFSYWTHVTNNMAVGNGYYVLLIGANIAEL